VSNSSDARISKTPGVCGGKSCITGHRIRVLDVVVWREHHCMMPDEIVSQFPTITPADVYAALAYYFDHIQEIQEEMRSERALAENSAAAIHRCSKQSCGMNAWR
jgi:uncharacterized protein (DUF433 family)